MGLPLSAFFLVWSVSRQAPGQRLKITTLNDNHLDNNSAE